MRLILLVLLSFGYGIIKVPADYPTIQAGIDAAVDGDIVAVYPDTYNENIELNKTITLTSLALFDTTTNTMKDSLDKWYGWVDGNWQVTDSLIVNTIIDGSLANNSTVTIAGDVCIEPQILGFTIQGGQGTEVDRFYENPEGETVTVKQYLGGGILSFKSNPTIHYNIIQNNGLTGDIETGGAIYAASSGEDCDFSSRRSKLNETCDNDSYDFKHNFFEHNKSKLGMHLANRKFDGEFDLSGSVFDYWNCQNPEYQTKCWVNIDEIEDLTADDYASNSCLRSEDTYVDPEFGNDETNTGSADSPFLTIGKAVVSVAGSEFAPVTINLKEGIYSPSTNAETFPINMISYVNLVGQSEEVTILNAEQTERVIVIESCENNIISGSTITGGLIIKYGGGGILLTDSSPTITDVNINGNTSIILGNVGGWGGGMYLEYSNPTLKNMTISNNTSEIGGGMILFHSSPIMKNILINGNIGGGIAILWESNPIAINITLSGNINAEGENKLFNITMMFGSLSILNSIIGTQDPEFPIQFLTTHFTYSNISVDNATWVGEGNIYGDPLFTDPENGDYTLQEGSPCIDAGTAFYELDGDTLINISPDEYYGSAPDMGAYEYGAVYGCLDSDACNYNIEANITDHNCEYSNEGYDCEGELLGCLDNAACNYDENAVVDDNSCEYSDEGYDCEGNVLSIVEHIIPDSYNISSIYPNPFNPAIIIKYGLPKNANVEIIVYDIIGRQVQLLINTFQKAGYHTISWNASSYPSGVYLIRMDSEDFTQTQKVVLIK